MNKSLKTPTNRFYLKIMIIFAAKMMNDYAEDSLDTDGHRLDGWLQ